MPDDPDLEEIEELQLAEVFQTDEDLQNNYIGTTINVDSKILEDQGSLIAPGSMINTQYSKMQRSIPKKKKNVTTRTGKNERGGAMSLSINAEQRVGLQQSKSNHMLSPQNVRENQR